MEPELVKHIASLARLEISEQEIDEVTRNLQRVLDYFASIRDIDTDTIPPTRHSVESHNIYRTDLATSPTPREKMLDSAPSVEDGQIVVPRVIE